MIVNFPNTPVIKGQKSIFLAGPVLRTVPYADGWRNHAITILQQLKFNGIVYVPEFPLGTSAEYYDVETQTFWEWEAMDSADVIVFWVPRDENGMEGYTTNIEFGRYLTKSPEKIILGFPKEALRMDYMTLLYANESKREPTYTLQETLESALMLLGKDG